MKETTENPIGIVAFVVGVVFLCAALVTILHQREHAESFEGENKIVDDVLFSLEYRPEQWAMEVDEDNHDKILWEFEDNILLELSHKWGSAYAFLYYATGEKNDPLASQPIDLSDRNTRRLADALEQLYQKHRTSKLNQNVDVIREALWEPDLLEAELRDERRIAEQQRFSVSHRDTGYVWEAYKINGKFYARDTNSCSDTLIDFLPVEFWKHFDDLDIRSRR